MQIRLEQDNDHREVHALNVRAFDSPAEADLVDRLRREADSFVSLVAEDESQVVGHIMLTPVVLSNHPHLRLMGLAPMAVEATHRGRGIGSALVRAGLERCAHMGIGAVVVLGHPGYYPRFGFRTARDYGIGCTYDAPPEAFMVVELQPRYLADKSGTVSYHAAFADV